MRTRAWRLRVHLSALVLPTMGLALAILVASGLVWGLPQLERESLRQLRLQNRDVATRTALLLGARQSRLGLLAEGLDGHAASDSAVLQSQVGPGRDVRALYLLTAQGVLRATARAGGAPPAAPGRDLVAHPLFASVRSGQSAAWSGDATAQPTAMASASLAYRRADGLLLDSYPGALGQTLGQLVHNAVLHGFAGRDHGRVRITGGRPTVHSTQGRGSCFELRLPDSAPERRSACDDTPTPWQPA